MAYRIEFVPDAEAALEGLPPESRRHLRGSLGRVAIRVEGSGVSEGPYDLVVDGAEAKYRVEHAREAIVILAVGKR